MLKYVMALDQGTTSSRAVLFDKRGAIVASAQRELPAIYPQPGWVEQEPHAILDTQLGAAAEVIAAAGITPDEIAAIGITNQRETTIVWERDTGEPVHNAIVWQCRRTARMCDELSERGWDGPVRSKTGLVIDPYFSATKVKWILDNVPGVRGRAEKGDLLFGNVDTWLIWNLTGGRAHSTDYSNASRTMLFNIHSLDWDEDILGELGIPRSMLPAVAPSSAVYGDTEENAFGSPVPIAGSAGDQQAALFGQACFREGMAKNTYGTGCFLLMNTGETVVPSENGLLTTIAWGVDGRIDYALEGSVFIAGAVVQWLRDELGLIESAAESEKLATSVEDTNGVYVVPAFVGLGAPYWDANARGVIVGLTRGARREHIVRAALEAMAYQAADVLRAMEDDLAAPLPELRVDGGAGVNDFLLQFQADILGVPVVRPDVIETTALGAAYLAGLAVGYWGSMGDIEGNWRAERTFEPGMDGGRRAALLDGWHRAVERAKNWIEG